MSHGDSPRPAARVVRALAAAALCLGIASCGVVSAVSTQEYLESVRVRDVDLSALPPGSYTGDYRLALPPDLYARNRHFNVTVTVTPSRDVQVAINEPASLSAVGAEATQEMNARFRDMANRIATARAIPVDGVSGATFSSAALLKAVETAAAQAVAP